MTPSPVDSQSDAKTFDLLQTSRSAQTRLRQKQARSLIAGGVLLGLGIARRSWFGLLMAAYGVELVVEGLTERPLSRHLQRAWRELNAPARRFGNGNDLVWQIKRARDNAKRAAVDVMPSLQAYNFPQRPDASPPPTTYWKHLEWVKVRVEYGAGLGKLRSAVDDVQTGVAPDAVVAVDHSVLGRIRDDGAAEEVRRQRDAEHLRP